MTRSIKKMACIIGLSLLVGAVAWAGDGQIDIADIPYTISSSGSYIVVDDLSTTATNTDGITIDADNVTLDLNGHALIGPGKAAGTTGSGINVSGSRYNIAIRNGTVRDWRGNGVNCANANNSQFEALRCYNNGNTGLAAGSGSTVTGNTCLNNGDDGISGYSGTVTGNICRENADNGIQTGNGATVSGNTCQINTGDGIQVSNDCRVVDNTCDNNGYFAPDGAGIHATSSGNCIERNLVTDNVRGIDCNPATGNYIASNRASGNGTQYDIVGGNTVGAGDLANVSF